MLKDEILRHTHIRSNEIIRIESTQKSINTCTSKCAKNLSTVKCQPINKDAPAAQTDTYSGPRIYVCNVHERIVVW